MLNAKEYFYIEYDQRICGLNVEESELLILSLDAYERRIDFHSDSLDVVVDGDDVVDGEEEVADVAKVGEFSGFIIVEQG